MGEDINKYGTRSTWRANREAAMKKSMAGDVLKSLRSRRRELTAQKRDTDSRMTTAQRNAVRTFEDSVKNLKTERVALIDDDGAVLTRSSSGSNTRTRLITPRGAQYPDAILTHNHPTEKVMGDNLAGRVNNTLSYADMDSAIHLNTRGMRVITGGGYTYSVERKGDTWGVSENKFKREMKSLSEKYIQENYDKAFKAYQNEANKTTSRAELDALNQRYKARANVAGQHRAMKELAKKYGWTYTYHS